MAGVVSNRLKSFLPIIKRSYLKWFSDSPTAVRIIQVGSMKKELHDLAIKSFNVAPKTKLVWIFNGFHGRTLKGRTT